MPGLRVYVLGPPENAALVRQSEVSSSRDEIYNIAPRIAPDLGLAAALDGGEPERGCPFDSAHRISTQQAKAQPFFREQYGFSASARDVWRRIEDDWLDASGDLALKLDNDTNNTSLVLAFESAVAGEVLLFAADAQVGNWLSWSERSWTVPGPRGTARTVTGPDVLKRTVL